MMMQKGGVQAKATQKGGFWTREPRAGAEDGHAKQVDQQICPCAATGDGGSHQTVTTTRTAQAASQIAKSSLTQQPCAKNVPHQNAPATDRPSHPARSPAMGKHQKTGTNALLANALAFGASMMMQKGGVQAKATQKGGFWTREPRAGAEDGHAKQVDQQICPCAATTGDGGSHQTVTTNRTAQASMGLLFFF